MRQGGRPLVRGKWLQGHATTYVELGLVSSDMIGHSSDSFWAALLHTLSGVNRGQPSIGRERLASSGD